MRVRFRDVPFALKFLVMPILFSIVFGAIFLAMSRQNAGLLSSYSDAVVSNAEVAAFGDLVGTFDAAVVELFQMLALASVDQATVNIENDLADIRQSISDVQKKIDALQDNRKDEAALELIRQAADDLNVFSESLSIVADMAQLDAATAVGFTQPLNEAATNLKDRMSQLVEREIALIRTQQASTIERINTAYTQIIVIGVVAGLLLILSTIAVARHTTRGVVAIAQQAAKLAQDDAEADSRHLERKDELGHIVEAFDVFRDNILERRRLQAAREAERARSAQERRDLLDGVAQRLSQSVEETVERVHAQSKIADTCATDLAGDAESLSSETGTVEKLVQETDGSAGVITASIRTLTAAIQDISNNTSEAVSLTGASVDQANVLKDKMDTLTRAASDISGVVELITAIAEKTNLLSLNATIEAARAGESGRGFAVVAGEVKTLANQTRTATEEITNQVSSVQNVTQEVVKAIEMIADGLTRVSETVLAIASAVEEQQASTVEVESQASRVAGNTDRVQVQVSSIAERAPKNRDRATLVLESVRLLREDTDQLVAVMNTAIRDIRSA